MITRKTIIPIGVPRSGTSMLAGILRNLGVFMGYDIKPDKHEDMEILFKPLPTVMKVIDMRNLTEEVWGFKTPWIGLSLRHIESKLINPKYIRIVRNEEDSIKSDLKRNKNTYRNGIINRNRKLNILIDTFLKNKENLELDYDYIIKNKEDAVKQIVKFIDEDVSEDKIKSAIDFIQPGGYRKIK